MSIKLKDTIYDLVNKSSNSDKLDGIDSVSFLPISAYNYTNGCLVKTDIPAKNSTMITFWIEGNTYDSFSGGNILTLGQFYDYSEFDYINHNVSISHFGFNFGNITLLRYDGYVCLWFKQIGNYQSFIVKVFATNKDENGKNRVISISNSGLPTGSKVTSSAEITPKTIKDYASGTWGISISGNAATASSVAWGNITGKPSTFPHAEHSHNYASTVKVGSTSYSCSSNVISLPAYPTLSSLGAAAASHSHSYLPLSGGTLTGGVGMNSKYLIKPSAEYTCTTTAITGAICVTLPSGISDTMTSMWIDVYNYVTSTSFSVHVCGYTYTNSTWQHNPSAMVYGANHTVRLGHNGTSFCIYIGETTSTWKYPQVIVRDVIVGYSGNYSNWSKAWTISFVTSFSSVTATLSDYALTTKNWSSICAPASHTHSQYLTSLPNYAGSSSQGGAATSAAKLTTVSKTAWGQTYWTSGGVPTSISGAMSSVSSITFNNGNNSIIFNPKGEAALHAGDSWTILGYGTAGSGKDTYIDGNNIKFRYGTSWTEGMFLTNSGRFGLGINPTAYKADIRATENSDYDIHYYNQTTKSSLFIGKYFWYGTSNTSGEMFSISSGTNADGSGGSRFIRILADGKVGVNTTPSYNLHVVGSTYSSSHMGTGGNLYVSQTAGTGAGISLYSNQSFVQSYGIWCGLGSTWGTVGDCTTGDWHMYFGMDGANNRGWLFRHASNGVVASVASDGNFTTKAWYRTKGSGGWYSIDYGGGWYMNDSSWIRSFNYKPLYININENNTYGTGGHRLAAAFYGSSHVSILLSNTVCGWGICSNGNKNLYFGYRNNTSLTSSTGDTYPMYITPSGYIHASHLEGHSNSATYLYASDSPYRWNDSSPYYMRMRYNTNSDNRWYLSVYPETPKSVSVDWAYGADSIDGYHISVGSSAGTNASTIYFIV
jgi:hypothetical protein